MKTIFTILAFLTVYMGFSQNGELSGRVLENTEMGFPGLEIQLIQNGKLIYQTETDIDGYYIFKNIPFGTYSIKIVAIGMREEIIENISIDTQKKVSNFTYPKPCVSNKKVCPKGNRDKIIPIVYGFPNKKTQTKAKNKKVKLGGCTPYCEKWHCNEHDLDF